MRPLFFPVLGLVYAGVGCGHPIEPSARVVGFVVDGQTGARLDFFQSGTLANLSDDKETKTQIYTLVDGAFHRAVPCAAGDATASNGIDTSGCYQLDKLPTGITLPIFAQAPGYERFAGQLDVTHEQQVANLRLFPKGFSIDYRFRVHLDGRPVPATTVSCQIRQATNSLETDGAFLAPQNEGSPAVTAETDMEGLAVIPGAQLVKGAEYHCVAFRNDPLDGQVLSGELELTAGVTTAELALPLRADGAKDDRLYATSSNVDNPDELHGAGSALTVTFSRSVELVPSTADCQVATLLTSDVNGNAQTGSLPAAVPNNNASEQVNATLSGDGLTLTLTYKTPAMPLDPGDVGTSIVFGGVLVRPTGARTDAAAVRSIGPNGACAAAAAYGNVTALQNARTGGDQSPTLRLF